MMAERAQLDEPRHVRPILTDRGPMAPWAAFAEGSGITRGEQWESSPTFLCGEAEGTHVFKLSAVTCKGCVAALHA